MTMDIFLGLLAVFSIATSAITQGIKKILDSRAADVESAVVEESAVGEAQAGADASYSTNIIVLIVALVVGCGGTALYYYLSGIPFTTANISCMVLMGFANWFCAMVGYDKVKQTIEQITG